MRVIYYCPACDSSFSNEKVKECPMCPDCHITMFETNILQSDWEGKSDIQKSQCKDLWKEIIATVYPELLAEGDIEPKRIESHTDINENIINSFVHSAKFCNKCGNKLVEGSKFCNKCGASTQY